MFSVEEPDELVEHLRECLGKQDAKLEMNEGTYTVLSNIGTP